MKPRRTRKAVAKRKPLPPSFMHYEEACRALAACRRVDEAKMIADKADALRVYARRARNRTAEIDCAQIRIVGLRRVGELLVEAKGAGQVREGRPGNGLKSGPFSRVTLKQAGIDKNLSAAAQKLAAIPAKQFETSLREWRARSERDGGRVIVGLAGDGAVLGKAQEIRAHQAAEKRSKAVEARTANAVPGGTVENLHELAASGFKAGVILADPPWRFRTWAETNDAKSARAHYDLMDTDKICGLPIAACAADDCALFIWATWPTIFHTQQVIDAWGFRFSGLAWEWFKENPTTGKAAFGLGYGTRKNLEPCLLAIRGKPTLISRSERDFLVAPRREHSKKPDEQYERIEAMYGGPNLELFGRRSRPGWMVWGNEVEFPDLAPALNAEPVAA